MNHKKRSIWPPLVLSLTLISGGLTYKNPDMEIHIWVDSPTKANSNEVVK